MKLATQRDLKEAFDANLTDISLALARVKPKYPRKRPMLYDWDEAQEAVAEFYEKRAFYYREKSEMWKQRADDVRKAEEPE